MTLAIVAPLTEAPSLDQIVQSGLLAIGLAVVHLLAGQLRWLDQTPRSRWLSFGSGVSVAYVFVHILPDLSEAQETVSEAIGGAIGFLEHHVYLMALLGMSVFYGLERLVKVSRQRNEDAGRGDIAEAGVFWLHIGSFAVYNALIGYLLLHREEVELRSTLLFAVAMALHFVVNDYGLRQDHKHTYDRTGRWILAGAIVCGWAIGSGTAIDAAAIALLFSFLAGSVVLNVLKEELPEERESRFGAFVLGTGIYAVLLLAL